MSFCCLVAYNFRDHTPCLASRVDIMKIATWNLAATPNISEVMRTLDEYEVEIAAFQELDIYSSRSKQLRPEAWVAASTGYNFFYFPTLLLLSESACARPPNFGIAIATRHPVSWTMNFLLGPRQYGPPNAEIEMRALALACIATPHRRIVFGCTHLAHTAGFEPSRIRKSQAENISNITNDLAAKDTCVIGGDYNVPPESKDLQVLKEQFLISATSGSSGATYCNPETQEKHIIDYFFYRHCTVHNAQAVWRQSVSDHALLLADLQD